MYRTKQKIDYYNRFLDSIKSPFTKRVYVNALEHYAKDMGIASDYNKLIEELVNNDPTKIKELEDNLIEYISYLYKEKELSYSTVHTRLAGIFHFYTINRVNVNKTYVSKFFPQKKHVKKDTAYTRNQIGKILSTCNIRQKVLILLLASTGMRIGALHSLNLSHIQRVDVGSQYLYKLTVYDMEDEEYYTFTTPECAAAIDEYLEYRKRFGEQLKPDTPLIREEFDRNFIGQVKRCRPVSYHTVLRLVDDIIIQSGIRVRIRKIEGQQFKHLMHPVQRSHGFRKFAITQMKLAKVDWGDREYLVGHRHSRGLDENYDRTDESDRLQEYLKAVDLQ
jgi:integrase